jgi:hypothetical protein
VESCFKNIKETSTENGIVGVVHIHYVESYIFRAGIGRLPKDTGRDMEPTGLILLLPKPYNGFDTSFNCFLLKPI